MAGNKSTWVLFFLLISTSLSLLLPCSSTATEFPNKRCSYDAIYQFGDSISDTGNLIREGPAGPFLPFARLPYGQTYFNKATGRCSDGLLMIDFFAKALDLPLLNPYLQRQPSEPNLARDYSFKYGVNFAVAGSTALDNEFLLEDHIRSPVTNSSLHVQLNWFEDHLKSICKTSTEAECRHKLKNALFMVGETGGNDFNYAFLQGKTIRDAETLVPYVLASIRHTAEKLIEHGARRLVIPGNFPIGCQPIYLTAFKNNASSSYDKNNCLKDLNNFAAYYNNLLKAQIQQLKDEHPNVVILYADYYNALLWVIENASELGFEKKSAMRACCGTGGEYNFNMTRLCGTDGVSACSNPSKSISWDGIHMTQNAYQHMSEWLLRRLSLKSLCVS